MLLQSSSVVKFAFYCPICETEIELVIPFLESVALGSLTEALRETRWRDGSLLIDCGNDDCPGGQEMRRH